MSEIVITFPGGKRVEALAGDFVLHTDQPRTAGGDGSAPDPFTMFLASMGACAGAYVVEFCATRHLDYHAIRVVETIDRDEHGKVVAILFQVQVPPSFPIRYHDAIARAAAACKVKRTIAEPPKMVFETIVRVPTAA